MNMRTNVARLRDATERTRVAPESTFGVPELLSALTDVDYDVRQSQELLDAVLRHHRDYHAEISPRFCSSEPCRLAAEW